MTISDQEFWYPTPVSMADDPYADQECAGCQSGEDCDGWTTETLKCPTRRASDRQFDALQDAYRDAEDDAGFGSVR